MNRLYLLSWLGDTEAVPPDSLLRCEYVPVAAPVLWVDAACGLAERNAAACAAVCDGIERDTILGAVSRAAASGANPVMPRAVIPANSAGTTRRRAAIAMSM